MKKRAMNRSLPLGETLPAVNLSKSLNFVQRHKSSWGTYDDDIYASISVGQKAPFYLWSVSPRNGPRAWGSSGRADSLAQAVEYCDDIAARIRANLADR